MTTHERLELSFLMAGLFLWTIGAAFWFLPILEVNQ